MAQTTLVTAVEIRIPDAAVINIDQMPTSVETEGDLTALVFHSSAEMTTVTILLSRDDLRTVGSLLGYERVRDEYQRFYDFVGDNDPALVDAWHFGENVRAQEAAREEKQ